MRQASLPHGQLGPGAPPNHLRRESSSDMTNQGPSAANRSGFSQQGGRGRSGYNGSYQQQSMGYQASAQFRGAPSQGRGMPPPFQSGRPIGPYPNSPHQAARSPALANSMPGTPNMGQVLPMQAPQQFGGFPQHYMGAPQVHHPSTSAYSSDSFKAGKNRSWKEKNRNQQFYAVKSREPPRELFGHSLVADGQNFSERSERGLSPSDIIFFPPSFPDLPPPPGAPKIDLSPESGNFDKFLTNRQNYGAYPPSFDRMTGMPLPTPYIFSQMPYMQGMAGQPQSPQPGYQPSYNVGQYNTPPPQPQPMSRTSSQISERPNSSLGQTQAPAMPPPTSQAHTPQPKPVATATPAVQRTARTSAAIVIKTPDGHVLQLPQAKVPASPAQSNRSGTPPVVTSTPTPPPKSMTPQHAHVDGTNVKSSEQKILEFKEQMKKVVEAEVKSTDTNTAETKVTETKADEEAASAAEAKAKDEARAKEEAEAKAKEEEAKAAEEAKAREAAEAAEAQAAAEKAKQEEEEELERQIREMEEAEERREKAEAELLARRAAEKAAAEAANAEKNKLLAEENDRKLREQEREMERLEDERERKRLEAQSKAQKPDSQAKADTELDAKKEPSEKTDRHLMSAESSDATKEAPTTPNTLASKLSGLTLSQKGGDSGASTPASDDSMGPPPKLSRGKPAALNLAPLNTKPIEPPQPSAALQSLKSARFLTVLNSSLYPAGVSSPNPALNSAVTAKGKSFKYDKEFLLQFQKVFTEKPSMEFESQIKALIGDSDGGSTRAGSSRTPGGMGPRTNSNRNPPGAFAMGSFGTVGSGKTLPPGTTSAERFAMAQGAIPRPTPNPMAAFNRPGGAFPSSNPMTRTPSSSNMGSMGPHSPRQQNSSRRQGSKRETYKENSKQEAQNAKNMPLTASMDIKPIQISATGWKPRSVMAQSSATGAAGPAPGASGSGHMDPDMVQRKVKAALNKMTPEKFDKIADQILAIAAQSKDEADGRTLRQVIQLTFEKATDEAHWASMYARFCKRMLETMSPEIKDESILDKNGNVVSGGNLFRKYLLNRCQEEFERGWKMDLGEKPEGEEGEAKTEEAAMLSDAYYKAAAAKRRGLGLVQFIGELYKLGMLTERIMHECVKKLVDYTGIPDEAEIESLTKLLRTIGGNLDSTEKGKPMMDVYFTRIQAMIDTPELPSRLRFMLMDVVDLRKNRWQSKEDNKGPKTLEEVRADVSSPIVVLMFVANLTTNRLKLPLPRRRLRVLEVTSVEVVAVAACRWVVETCETFPVANMETSLQSTIKRIQSRLMTSVVLGRAIRVGK
jgi:translation initiation factor 4G